MSFSKASYNQLTMPRFHIQVLVLLKIAYLNIIIEYSQKQHKWFYKVSNKLH